MAALRSVVVAALLSGVVPMLSTRSGCAQRGPQIFEQWARGKNVLERSLIGTAAVGHTSTEAFASDSYSTGEYRVEPQERPSEGHGGRLPGTTN